MPGPPAWEADIQHRNVVSQDGVTLDYQVLGDPKKPVLSFANGLGGRLYSFEPIVEALLDDFYILTWDYRGLFQSGAPERIRALSIPNHANDLKNILDAEKIRKTHLIGWSMGVQVALEFAALYPEKLDRMVLINGTYGRALDTGFQPLFPIPGGARVLHGLIDFARSNPPVAKLASFFGRSPLWIEPIGFVYGTLRGNRRIRDILRMYMNDVLGESFSNYLRLFQELDAHYSFHLLKEITHPALIVWGDLDFLTPGYQSRKMRKRLVNCQHLRLPLGTHFAHLEYPKKVPRRIKKFLS